MDKIKIRVMIATTGNRTAACQRQSWTTIAYKLADLWDNGNYT